MIMASRQIFSHGHHSQPWRFRKGCFRPVYGMCVSNMSSDQCLVCVQSVWVMGANVSTTGDTARPSNPSVMTITHVSVCLEPLHHLFPFLHHQKGTTGSGGGKREEGRVGARLCHHQCTGPGLTSPFSVVPVLRHSKAVLHPSCYG